MFARKYLTKTNCELIEKIRKEIPHSSIITDIIVGFPGEILMSLWLTKENENQEIFR